MCKRILKFELQLSSYWQNIKFSRYYPKFHIFTKMVIFKYICNFLDRLLHPYKFHGRDMSGILFFIFASCEPLSLKTWVCWCFTVDRAFWASWVATVPVDTSGMILVRKTWMFPYGGLTLGKQRRNLLVINWGFWVWWYVKAMTDLCSSVNCRSYIFRCLQPPLAMNTCKVVVFF